MGEDRDGNPVWYDNFNIDFKGIIYTIHGYIHVRKQYQRQSNFD